MSDFRQYLATIASVNHLGHDIEWVFYPGMLPESRRKWWGDFKKRPTAHEGIDICFYRNAPGRIRQLPASALVPAWSSGTVINICDDFLGRTLVVAPQSVPSTVTHVLEVYAHLSVCEGIEPGSGLRAGQIFARTSDTCAMGSVLPPHLHLSVIEVPSHIPSDALNWSLFPRRDHVNVMNPVFMDGHPLRTKR